MKVYVDTREQKPLRIAATPKALKVGDYTTETLHKVFAIERKSPNDLYGTLLKGHKRFRRELQRAEFLGIRLAVYVEVSKEVFLRKLYPGSDYQMTSGEILEKIIKTMTIRYDLEFVWCRNRQHMAELVMRRLKNEERKHKRRVHSK